MIEDIDQRIDGERDFQWSFYLNRKCLTVLGVWPSDKKESKLTLLRSPLILMIVVFGTCLPTTYALILVQNQLNLVIDNLLPTIACWMSASKVFLLWYYRPTNGLLIKWAKSNWSRISEIWEQQLMMKQARRGRLLTTFTCIVMFIHINCFLLATVFDLGIRIINNITDPNPQRILPLQSYYPYEYYKSPYFELTYLSQIIAMPFNACAYAAADTFFTALVFHASGQSEILTEKMNRLYDQRLTEKQSFNRDIRRIVKSHTRLVRFAMAIEQSFNVTIFIQIFGSMIMICSAVFALINAIDEAPPVMQIMVLVAGVLNVNEQLFLYCLTSEILASNSAEMFDAIYNSRWYNLPANEARYVVLILARTQYPLQLSAGKFFYLSLNSYIQLVKSTGGYISMLLAVS